MLAVHVPTEIIIILIIIYFYYCLCASCAGKARILFNGVILSVQKLKKLLIRN